MNKKIGKAMAVLLIFTFLLLPMVGFATDVEAPTIEMEDVSPEDWFYRYVVDGLRFEIITGVSGDTFRFVPDRNVTRAEFITMLGRLHEYGHGTIGTPGEGAFYERYLEWAVELGIIHGNRHGDLMPRSLITREQKAVVVYRYIDAFDLWDYFRHGYLMRALLFSDFMEISHWAQGPVYRLKSSLIVRSRIDGYYDPHHTVSRAEALQILIRVGSAVYDLVHPLRWW